MAETDEELELDVNQSKGSKMTTILLIALILLILIMGGVGAWFYLGKDDGGSSASAEKEEKVLEPLHYITMTPEFVVNFGPGSKVRYLQVDLQIATRDEAALQTVTTYRPVLRNDILVILSGLSFDELKSRSGKEALQMKLLNSINKVVVSAGHATSDDESKEDKDDGHGSDESSDSIHVKGPIENVYFTSFIMQ
jgi:flagellar FliL protein